MTRGAGALAWCALAGVLAVLALAETLGAHAAAHPLAFAHALDWQPGHGMAQPWRAWTAAGVHWSDAHLVGNLVAAALVTGLGVQARVGGREALAWALAWPLTHALMGAVDALAPGRLPVVLPHYGGLSGVLHAGVAIVALALVARPVARTAAGGGHADGASPRERLVGAALLVGLAAKLVVERPWTLAPRPDALLGIQVATLAHATGVAAGLAAWAALAGLSAFGRRYTRPRRPLSHPARGEHR